ncbi:MAG: radical SAM protein [bacterium]|nr:radical SAM protein [bacterium]
MKLVLVGMYIGPNLQGPGESFGLSRLKSYLDSRLPDKLFTEIVYIPINEIEQEYENFWAESLLELNPEMIGFSCWYYNFDFFLALAGFIKKRMETKIVLGGPDITGIAEEVMTEFNFVDYIIEGKGEYVLRNLVEGLLDNRDLKEVRGVVRRDAERICRNENEPEFVKLDDIPSPFMCGILPDRKVYMIESYTGCKYQCSYCLWNNYNKMDFLSDTNIGKEIEFAVSNDYYIFSFIDSSINLSNRYFEKIIFLIKLHDPEGKLKYVFYLDAATVTESQIDLLKQVNVGCIGIGLQTVGVEARKNMKGPALNIENLKKNLLYLRKSLPQTIIDMDVIIGLPGDNSKTVLETSEYIKDFEGMLINFHLLNIYPGTPFYYSKEKYKIRHSVRRPFEIESCYSFDEIELEKMERVANDFRYMIEKRLEDDGYYTISIDIFTQAGAWKIYFKEYEETFYTVDDFMKALQTNLLLHQNLKFIMINNNSASAGVEAKNAASLGEIFGCIEKFGFQVKWLVEDGGRLSEIAYRKTRHMDYQVNEFREIVTDTTITFDEIKSELESAVRTGTKNLVLVGGKPPPRPDFLEIIRLAKGMGHQSIHIRTDGRMLSESSFFLKTLEAGVDSYEIQLLSDNSTLSNAPEIISVIKHLIKYGKDVTLLIPINKDTYKDLPDIAYFAGGLGVKQILFEFIFSAVVKISHCLPFLFRVFEYADETGLDIKVKNIPYCALDKFQYRIYEKAEAGSVDEVILSECFTCKFSPFCSKLSRAYIELFGITEFKYRGAASLK